MEVFPPEEVERGRRYHRPRYLTALAGFLIGGAALAVLAFTDVGEALLPNWPWWAQALVYPTIVLAVVEALVLPLAFWRGYVHEHRWGLSTQDVRGWAVDRAKGFAVGSGIATALFVGFFALARSLPDAWPL